MIKLAIFDLDGTLVNSLYDLADAVNKALADNGFPVHGYDEYRYFVGNGAKKLIERALPPGTPENVREMIHSRFSENYHENCLAKTRAYEGTPELLERLSSAGVMCAVASNKPDEFSAHVVEGIFGKGVFTLIRGKREGVPVKPAPDIIRAIAEETGCELSETAMIGDSGVDVETAHNAGIKCIGCVWGFRGEEELVKAGADSIAHTPADIADIIGV